MLRKIVARIDALGDRFPPVLVLLLKRGPGTKHRGLGSVIACELVWITAFFVCVFRNHIEEFLNEISLGGPSPAGHIVPAMGVIMYSLIIASSMGGSLVAWHLLAWKDPLFRLTPLSDRDILVGSYYPGLWTLVYLIGFFGPLAVTLHALRILSADWALFYPGVTCLLGWMYFNVFTSFVAAARTGIQRIVVGCLGMISGAVIYLGGVFSSLGLAMLPVFHPHWASFATLAERRCWFPVLLVAAVGSYFLAWRLVDFNLARQRAFPWKLAVTFGTYLLCLPTLAGLWLLLWYLFG